LKQALHLGFLPTLLAILIAGLAIAYPADAQQTFSPTLEVAVDDPTPETASDVQVNFGIPLDDVQFAAVVQFIPPDWGIVTEGVPIGADIGNLESQATLGLINGACQTQLPVVFEFKNSSLDRNDTVSFFDADDNGTADYAEDKDENDLFDGVDKYPSFLNSIFPDLQPIRRAAGFTIVAGTPVLLQFLIFEPGTEIDELIPADKDLGFPTVAVLQNIGDDEVDPEPGVISDFCAPLTTENIVYGVSHDNPDTAADEGGIPLFINPQNGTYKFTTVSLGQRDADGDGYENSLDTCPLDVNVGNPTEANSGDLDSDGLDAACDPNDDLAAGGTDSDEDADGYLNRQDNCPREPNGEAEDNQADADIDQIGDACDPNPDTADGELLSSQLNAEIIIGDGTGAGGPPDCVAAGATNGCFVVGENGNGPNGPDGGSNSGVIIGIIVAVIAAVVIIGGGAFMMMRRREGA
jgi:hypothetical protein